MADDDRKKTTHPSGRPIRGNKYGQTSKERIPRFGPLTPGLRHQERIPAIGFTARLTRDQEED